MRHETLHCLGPNGFHRISYLEWGDPHAERVVVCAHGLTRNARDFDFLARRLARRWRVVCLDVAGRGRSDWLPSKADYGFDLYQSDAAALMARATAPARRGLFGWLLRLLPSRARSVDWVGTSMGGIIGMLLAARAGSPIRRLVLNDVGATIPWSALARMKGMMRRHEPFADMRAVVRHVRETYAGFGPLSEAQWRHLARHSVQRLKGGHYQLSGTAPTSTCRSGRRWCAASTCGGTGTRSARRRCSCAAATPTCCRATSRARCSAAARRRSSWSSRAWATPRR
jgi:pimeloyl-ACP methyl ester carboxylesterase